MTKSPTGGYTQADQWREMYRRRPYLQNCHVSQLADRLEHCVVNGVDFTPEKKIGLLPPDNGGMVWMERMAHLMAEVESRKMRMEELFDPFRMGPLAYFHDSNDPSRWIPRNESLFKLHRRGGVFCKFGDRKWIDKLVNHGDLRLTPASRYNAPTLGSARYDDELTIKTDLTPFDYDLGLIPDVVMARFPEREWRTVRLAKPSDHYLYCFTTGFNTRFFFDFQTTSGPADACAIISNQNEFTSRLLKAVQTGLPGWDVWLDFAKYVDPFTAFAALSVDERMFYSFKEIRFMYQREHRLIAVPPPNSKLALDYFPVNIGPLNDIAEIVEFRR